MSAQAQLVLFQPAPADANVAYLVKILREAKGWLRASEIEERVCREWNDRKIRCLAEAAGGQVISGQKGYKHMDHATAEEIDHAAAWLESQARKMSERACEIRRAAHRRVG